MLEDREYNFVYVNVQICSSMKQNSSGMAYIHRLVDRGDYGKKGSYCICMNKRLQWNILDVMVLLILTVLWWQGVLMVVLECEKDKSQWIDNETPMSKWYEEKMSKSVNHMVE